MNTDLEFHCSFSSEHIRTGVKDLILHAAVQMHYAPRSKTLPPWDIEEEEDPDVRLMQYARDHRLMEDLLQHYEEHDAQKHE